MFAEVNGDDRIKKYTNVNKSGDLTIIDKMDPCCTFKQQGFHKEVYWDASCLLSSLFVYFLMRDLHLKQLMFGRYCR